EVDSEQLLRWAPENPRERQRATDDALGLLVYAEYAAATLLTVLTLLRSEQAIDEADGFLRQPRGAVEHFRLRAHRAIAWMDLFIFFRERFPGPAQRHTPDALYNMGQLFGSHGDEVEAAVDLLIRECVMAEIEEILSRT